MKPLIGAPHRNWVLIISRLLLSISILIPWFVYSIGMADDSTPAWTVPHRIPDYWDESRAPVLVADQNKKVYAFNTQPDGKVSAIFIREWSVEQGWSPPVDIMLPPLPGGAPSVEGAYLDPSGIIHMAFFSGSEVDGAIFYTYAPAYVADQPNAWSTPEPVGTGALGMGIAFAGDANGNLLVVYGGRNNGIGLYGVSSSDSGATWSDPTLVGLVVDNRDVPNGVRLIIDPKGIGHVIWAEVDQIGIDQYIVYSHHFNDGNTWSKQIILAKRESGDYKAAWPTIISYNDSLMVMYQKSSPATRWIRRSFDGGETWTDPVRPWPHVGEYMFPNLLVDSNNVLHVVLGFRNGECCHGMWHGVWLGDQWGPLQPIVIGPKTPQFDPSDPHVIISQGNVILATWWTDTGGAPRNGAWFSYAELSAPELPIQPLLKPTLSAAALETDQSKVQQAIQETLTPTPVQTPTLVPTSADFTKPSPYNNPQLLVMAGVVPAVLVVIMIFIWAVVKKSR